MSFQLNVPPSVLAKIAKSAEGEETSEEDGVKRREDYKKLKELEEARKAGTAPAMKDESGKDINPHIPQYIMQAPWYFGSTAPTLRHQRPQDEKQTIYDRMGMWYKKGLKEGAIATKFRKGACENCGALTHKKKDCLERPRKIGAKHSGSNFAPDEYIATNLNLDYDGKRDRWNGYDLEDHTKIAEEFAKIEEAKKHLRGDKVLQEGDETKEKEEIKETNSDEGEDEDKYADDVDMPGQKFESKQRITVRNLRIREDTAKYLYNLDVNSAYYDPKTRSMRDNPFQDSANNEKALMFGGDNFVRWSGDAHNMAERQVFAWDAYEKGADVHLQADPTKLEILAREYKEKKKNFKNTQKEGILEKYGGEEHLDAPPKEMLMAQSEDYVEYSRTGTVIKGQEKAKVKSLYEEDVYINNHKSIWGSYWKEGKWGFRCCHSTIKESYCTGAAGKEASQASLTTLSATADKTEDVFIKPKVPQITDGKFQWTKKIEKEQEVKESDKKKKRNQKKKQHKTKKGKRNSSSSSSSSSSSESSSSSSDSSSSDSSSDSGSDSEDEDKKREKRIKQAMEKEEKRQKEVDKMMKLDERKRPYNSMYNDVAPNEDEMEAFRRKKHREDDPMAKFLS